MKAEKIFLVLSIIFWLVIENKFRSVAKKKDAFKFHLSSKVFCSNDTKTNDEPREDQDGNHVHYNFSVTIFLINLCFQNLAVIN